MKRGTKFLKILLTIPLALIVAGYASVVAQVVLDDYYKPVPPALRLKPDSTNCPCWDPEEVSGLFAVPWRLDALVNIVYETSRPEKGGSTFTLIDAWEDYPDGNCLRAGVFRFPKEKFYGCDVAWGLWKGDYCDIEEEDVFEASYDEPPISRSCEIAANETIGYISTVVKDDENIITVLDDPANSVGLHSSIAIGSDGFPVISYRDETANALKVAKCHNVACSDGEMDISTIENGGFASSIAIGDDGLPVISHRSGDLLRLVKCNDLGCTGGDETSTILDSGLGPYSGSVNTSVAINTDGFPVIAYDASAGFTADSIKLITCNDLACTGGDETVNTVHDPSEYVGASSLAIGLDGFPVISYFMQHIIPTTLMVAKCNDPECGGSDETITTLDGPGVVGTHSSIAIGEDGFPVISYRGPSSLKVAKCNDDACTGGDESITTVDDAGDVGEYTSIAIGLDPFPVISYFDRTNGALKVAKCNDAACSGNDETISTVDDPADSSGFQTSIAIGDDGLPVISYWQYAEDGAFLKLVHCGDSDCNP
jgi:hypothetical protein